MKKLFIFICLAILLSACGSNPADTELRRISPETGNEESQVQILESVEISSAETLVLKEVEIEVQPNLSRTLKQSVWERCDELGTLDNGVYEKIALHGNQTPCFKNVHFWDSGMIYGQYKPSDSSPDVWFITDANGKVHHLPGTPKKDRGFKNDKSIRKYQGKPIFLTQEDFLAGFDMSTDEEEIIIESRVGRYVVLPKNNGDHIVYTDLEGGKIRRPDGSLVDLSQTDATIVDGVPVIRGWVDLDNFFKNPSGDLTYKTSAGNYFNMIFDATGEILETRVSTIPVTMQEWYDNPIIGEPPPRAPGPNCGLTSCERDENLLLCETSVCPIQGFILADSSQDIQQIDWWDLGISGTNPVACLTDDFIYYAAGGSLHKIAKDLSASEEILTDFSVYTLQCPGNDNLIIHGLNIANSLYETFQLNGNIRTMIRENIAQFIR